MDAPLEEGLSTVCRCGPFPNDPEQSRPYKPKFALDRLTDGSASTNTWVRLSSPAPSSSMDRWHLGSLAASFVCLESKLSFCECGVWLYLTFVCCVCGPGCISSDKVVLNMFAQGPQGEKGPLTHEGLEPQWLHTHTHTKLANTTCKYRKRHGKLM